jgi:hypothetical protein
MIGTRIWEMSGSNLVNDTRYPYWFSSFAFRIVGVISSSGHERFGTNTFQFITQQSL